MKEINLTNEPEFGEEFKDTILKLRIIKAIMEGGDWGMKVLKFVDPNMFSVQIGGLHYILGVIKEQFMQSSEIPSIEEVKEVIYSKYVKDNVDKEVYDAVFKEYNKIHLTEDDVKRYRFTFKDLYLIVTLKKIRECMDNTSITYDTQESDILVQVRRLIKLLEELKFYYENTDNSTGVEVVQEW